MAGLFGGGSNENMPPHNYHNAHSLDTNADTLSKSPPWRSGTGRSGNLGPRSGMGATEDDPLVFLAEILSHAATVAGGGRGEAIPGRRASGPDGEEAGRMEGEEVALNVPLVDVLQSYEAVLRSHGMVPSEDTFYYRCAPPPAPR